MQIANAAQTSVFFFTFQHLLLLQRKVENQLLCGGNGRSVLYSLASHASLTVESYLTRSIYFDLSKEICSPLTLERIQIKDTG